MPSLRDMLPASSQAAYGDAWGRSGLPTSGFDSWLDMGLEDWLQQWRGNAQLLNGNESNLSPDQLRTLQPSNAMGMSIAGESGLPTDGEHFAGAYKRYSDWWDVGRPFDLSGPNSATPLGALNYFGDDINNQLTTDKSGKYVPIAGELGWQGVMPQQQGAAVTPAAQAPSTTASPAQPQQQPGLSGMAAPQRQGPRAGSGGMNRRPARQQHSLGALQPKKIPYLYR